MRKIYLLFLMLCHKLLYNYVITCVSKYDKHLFTQVVQQVGHPVAVNQPVSLLLLVTLEIPVALKAWDLKFS